MNQGEDALKKAISILSEVDGWTVETVAVSTTLRHKGSTDINFSVLKLVLMGLWNGKPCFLPTAGQRRQGSE